ncbi:hypothetical protein [Streptomyces sp. CBMA123]|uniref:hypothetical protein n=1 Tax=Streptomyces sp. CBMA123 TaxID=1896313 RepID=UPI0016620D7C|nr:hypothetical protein [Streptomyces sp. CBMA123]MBD0695837.1 hypothetical protein [Streptomyces sp. CBMA123]
MAELLAVSEELLCQDKAFLFQLDRAARHSDSALARQALDDVLHAAYALTMCHRELAERFLAAHPTQQDGADPAAPIPAVSPRGETEPLSATPPGAAEGERTVSRTAAPIAPRGETGPPPTGIEDPREPAGRTEPATDRTPPTERGLGRPEHSYAVGDGLVRLTWPHSPGIQALQHSGRLLGWSELDAFGDDNAWVAPIDTRPVTDAADTQVLLSANPDDAITLLRLELAQNLGGR